MMSGWGTNDFCVASSGIPSNALYPDFWILFDMNTLVFVFVHFCGEVTREGCQTGISLVRPYFTSSDPPP